MTTPDLGRVERIGNTVHRPVGPWTPAVHDLLRHLESVGIEVFAAAYGLADVTGLFDAVVAVQERDAVRRLADEGVEPQATWVSEGYLDELRARVAWSRANRNLFA
jgi:hypothetical protein